MNTTETQNIAGLASAKDTIQLVVFRLGEEYFGVDIAQVQEINRLTEVTKIPQAPDFIEGVINLRGKIIPIIDLRRRFNFPGASEHSKDTRIVVVETGGLTAGLVVDAVTEVLRLEREQIMPTPEVVSSAVENRYIEGVALLADKRLLILLNTYKIFSESETAAMSRIQEVSES